MPEQLWRKESHEFAVKIKVGETWVQHFTSQSKDKAMAEVDKVLHDFSVSAVQVEEHKLTHTCSLLFEDNHVAALKLAPKMKPTGRKAPCPRCALSSQVATDGTNEWIFCAKCESAFPG
jgi:hypothetical protein